MRFVLGSPQVVDTAIVTVDGGVATAQLDAYGAAGPTMLSAVDCEIGESCNVAEDAISVDVSLPDPVITTPNQNDVVGDTVTVKANISGGSLQFFLDGVAKGKDLEAPFEKTISLRDKNDGTHTVSVQQCNDDGSVCDGGTDDITVIKDTRGPRFTDVDSSLGTVYPVKDNYKDTVKLSARVAEKSFETKVEIRKAGGPLVRTLNLGREDAGRLSVSWNGRKSNGDVVPKGKYLFRFVGTDVNGVVGKSGDKVVYVSDKRLVKKTVTRTVSAKSSFYRNGSGACSGVYSLDYRQAKYDWPKGAGYYSRSTCNGSASDDTALALHRVAAPQAVRYGAMRIDTYGGGAFRHAGPGVILYIKGNGDTGAGRVTKQSLAWHSGPSVAAQTYVKNGRVAWAFGAVRGNWFDVKEYRLTFRISVLQ